jgi:hypothetical protein
MAQPTSSDVHVDAVLTNISVAYMQDTNDFIADKVFPVVPVEKQSDVYFVYTKADWFRDEAQERAPGTPSVGSGYGHTTAEYNCKVYAIHKDVDDQMRANADAPLDPDRDATEFVTRRLLLRRERQWASDYFTTGKWGTDVTGGSNFTVWSDYGGSDPITDVETGKNTVLMNTGIAPNTLVLGHNVARYLKHHPDLRDYTKAGSSDARPNLVNMELLARIFEVERVFVARAVVNTGLEGETASYSFVHGNHALLCYSAPTPSLRTPSAGYIFAWRGISRGLGETMGIKRFRMEELESDRIEGQIAFADKLVASDLGYFFSGAVS